MKGLILAADPQPALAPMTDELPMGILPMPGGPLLALQLAWLGRQGVEVVRVVLHHQPVTLARWLAANAPEGMRVEVSLAPRPLPPRELLRAQGAFLTERTVVLVDALVTGDLMPLCEQHVEARAGLSELPIDGVPILWIVDPGGTEVQAPLCLCTQGEAPCLACTPRGYAETVLAAMPDGVHVEGGAVIHPAAQLVAPCWVGKECRVGRDAVVGPHVFLADGAVVERGARLTQSVVASATRIGKATRWEEALVWRNGLYDLREARPRFALADSEELGWRDRRHLAETLAWLLDATLAALALVALAPLLLLIALAIWIDSPGPVLYTQLRVGQDRRRSLRGRVFELYKFRTMRLDADRERERLLDSNQYGGGPFFKLERDPRVTRLGQVLRATSLDELPQLLNVVLGDMRLVGNRPLPVYEAEALTEPWQRIRFACPAGITGLWQVSGRSDLTDRERLVLDAYYAVNRSPWLDGLILARTLPVLLLRRGAR